MKGILEGLGLGPVLEQYKDFFHSMLFNSAGRYLGTEQQNQKKKSASGRAIPSQMGDSAGTTTIVGLDSERSLSTRPRQPYIILLLDF